MKIYIDSEYKCHAQPADGMREFDVSFFDGKCATLIEGFRYIPEGETWAREDGEIFTGGMVSAWKTFSYLSAAQQGYEESHAELQDMQAALELLGVTPTEDTVGGE